MTKTTLDVFVVTHKKVDKEIKKKDYHYISVGKNQNDLPYEYKDNTGDNISYKNSSFCELTAQYWIWKNVKSDYVGLVHYRRFFFNPYTSIFKNEILSGGGIKRLFKKYDVIVPKPSKVFDSHCTNVYDHYCYQHYKRDIDEVGKIIEELYPDYSEAFNHLKETNEYSLCNMIITKKTIYDDYSKFLFDILFELEKRIDISEYNDYQKRIYGFLGERLLNVYLYKNNNLKIKYQSVVFIDDSNVFKAYISKIFKKIFHIKTKAIDYEPIK